MAEHYSMIFHGDELDAKGFPTPFHRYEIYVAKWHHRGGVASVIPTTVESPRPELSHYLTLEGGPWQAIEMAKEALWALHPGLNSSFG